MTRSKKLFRSNMNRTRQYVMAKTILVLVMTFLILNSPRLILGLIEVTQLSTVEECYEHGLSYNISKMIYLLDFIARFLVILNSSLNFIIYILVGSEFRTKLYGAFNIPKRMRRLSDPRLSYKGSQLRCQGKSSAGDENGDHFIDKTIVTRMTVESLAPEDRMDNTDSNSHDEDKVTKIDNTARKKDFMIETHF